MTEGLRPSRKKEEGRRKKEEGRRKKEEVLKYSKLVQTSPNGVGRTSNNEYFSFLQIALGSFRELDTQIIIAKQVGLEA
ncbi:MAG: four helix bundle protein [Nostocaceae cyanobacterium]|nr:four helix bundle protein [Nostocaceae cyanobacterium]